MAKKLSVKNISWRGLLSAEGLEVYLDDYDTREEAEEALYESVLQYLDYGIEEVDEIEKCPCFKHGKSLNSGMKCSNCGREL